MICVSFITDYMETGNASVSEEPMQECPLSEHQSCILSPEVSPSQRTKSKYNHFMTGEALPKVLIL